MNINQYKHEQFFTPNIYSELLVNLIDDIEPSVIVDIGAGDGALLRAASNRWTKAALVGIDIDPLLNKQGRKDFDWFLNDSLDDGLPKVLSNKFEHIDLAISNPPFTKIRRTKNIDKILIDAGFSNLVSNSKTYASEFIFLAQNLRLLNKGASLAIILPDGIISGERWKSLREILFANNNIQGIIELPSNAFKHTEANTHIVIIKKLDKPGKYIKLYKSNKFGTLTKPTKITVGTAINRADYSFYLNRKKWNNDFNDLKTVTLSELGAFVFRGKHNNAYYTKNCIDVCHTSNLSEGGIKLQYSVQDSALTDENYAIKGDIIISRVGTRCFNRSAFVDKGKVVVTDSVLVIRVPKKYQKLVWDAITSKSGELSIEYISSGVCAKYITKNKLLDMPLVAQ